MPLILNVGWSRKVGEPHYGSRGASLNLEVEVDGAILADPERLRSRIRQLFQITRASVDDELHSERPASSSHGAADPAGARGPHHGPPSSTPRRPRLADPDRPATSRQVRALHTAAERASLDLSRLLQQRFGLEVPDQLTLHAASQLLDELNGTSASRPVAG